MPIEVENYDDAVHNGNNEKLPSKRVMKAQLAKGVAWLSTAKLIINLLGLFSTFFLARLLTPEDFGLVALSTTLLAIIGSLTELSLSAALIQHKNPTEDHFCTAWTLNLIRGVSIALIFAAATPLIANLYHEPRLVPIMLFLSASIALGGFSNPKTVLWTRRLIFWQEFALSVSQKLGSFVVAVLLVVIYKSYWALVGGIMASQIIGLVISYLIIPFKPRLSFFCARELCSFSIWLTFGQIVNTLNWKFDHLLIGGYLGKSFLGYYTVGDSLASMPTREAIGPLETTLFPGFTQLVHEPVRLKNAYSAAQSLISSIALPAGFGFALIAHPVVLLVMGAKWLPAVPVVQVLACVFALQTLSSAVHPLAMAKGETKLLFHRDLLSLAIRIPIIIVGMVLGGLIGIIYARAFTGVIALLINMRLVQSLIGLSMFEQILANFRSLSSILCMTIVMGFLDFFWDNNAQPLFLGLRIAALLLSGLLTYITVHLLLWFLANKPPGPEIVFINLVKKLKENPKLRKFVAHLTVH